MPDENFAAAWRAGKNVANRRAIDPITIHRAGAHAVESLLTILLALVLADAGEKIFDQTAIGIFAEFD
jgi:hypothetical protein